LRVRLWTRQIVSSILVFTVTSRRLLKNIHRLLFVAGSFVKDDLVKLLIQSSVLVVEISTDIIEPRDLGLHALNLLTQNSLLSMASPYLIVLGLACLDLCLELTSDIIKGLLVMAAL
jgi:hypothetical protein